MFEKRIVFSLPGMERIAARANLIYKTADSGPLLADLYLPPRTTALSPIVIFIHGGIPEGLTPQPKDWGAFVSWGQLMAASGMAAVTFNHRMRFGTGFVPGTVAKAADDLADLIQYLRGNASGLNVDPTRIALVAFSAGGPLLAAPMLEQYEGVRCSVALYAYLGDTTAPDVFDAARFSAIGALNARRGAVPPMFVARAGKDHALINEAINSFVTRAQELGAPIQFTTHPEGVHGFDVQTDDDTSRAIIRQTLEFIGAHLRD
jgi:acetyl esterase/lipase